MKNQSFQANFIKKGKAALRFLLTAAVIGLLLSGVICGADYLVVDDADSYTRLTMHEFYGAEDVETVFLGSSHCFRAYDPALYTEKTGERAFNLGSSAQNYDTSYYLLKEAFRTQPIRKVYLDMHYAFLFTDPKDRDLVQANIISDYMRPSLNKLDFILHMSDSSHYTNSFFPFRREWRKLGELSYLKENLQKKSTAAYRNYEPVINENEYYVNFGFVYSEEQLNTAEITWWEKFTKIDMSGDASFAKGYIDRIVELCRKNQAELIFVTAPSNAEYLQVVGPYEQAHDYIQAMADAYSVSYLDFNECTEDELSLSEKDFMDVDHLNGQGAEKVTVCLTEQIGK